MSQQGPEPFRFPEACQSNRGLSLTPGEGIAFRQVIWRRRCFFEYALPFDDVRLALRVMLRPARRQHYDYQERDQGLNRNIFKRPNFLHCDQPEYWSEFGQVRPLTGCELPAALGIFV